MQYNDKIVFDAGEAFAGYVQRLLKMSTILSPALLILCCSMPKFFEKENMVVAETDSHIFSIDTGIERRGVYILQKLPKGMRGDLPLEYTLWASEHSDHLLTEDIVSFMKNSDIKGINIFINKTILNFSNEETNCGAFIFNYICKRIFDMDLDIQSRIQVDFKDSKKECLKKDHFRIRTKKIQYYQPGVLVIYTGLGLGWAVILNGDKVLYPLGIFALFQPFIQLAGYTVWNSAKSDSFALENLEEYKAHLMEVIRNAKEKNLFTKCE